MKRKKITEEKISNILKLSEFEKFFKEAFREQLELEKQSSVWGQVIVRFFLFDISLFLSSTSCGNRVNIAKACGVDFKDAEGTLSTFKDLKLVDSISVKNIHRERNDRLEVYKSNAVEFRIAKIKKFLFVKR